MPRLALALPALVVSSVASAQSMAVDSVRPAIDSRGFLTLDASQVLDHKDVSFGIGSLQWGHHGIDDIVTATLVAALGVRVGIPLELGASLPFTITSGSRDDQDIGDVGLHGKVQLARVHRLGVGMLASVYLGEAATPQFMGLVDGTFGRFRVAINGGVRMGSAMAMGTTFPAGVAAAYGLVPEKIELVGEVFGTVPTGRSDGYQPLEALGGVKVYLAKSSYLSLGAGRGLLPDREGSPDFRAVIGIVFEPKPAQRAFARVPDERVAMAPPAPQGGAPLDSDNDGIFDKDDHCIDVMESYNGVEDDDGCPERKHIVETESEIVTLQPIEFEFDKDVLRDSAFPILDEVVQALQDNPGITLVEVEGHTDEQGNDAYNLDLSRRRAATVMRYLRDHGVDSLRLTSEGYGESRPVDPRHTQEAYRTNRRVAFSIKERI
jgi:outer membrane protein OmpA-like peptidoglycan-associated protein